MLRKTIAIIGCLFVALSSMILGHVTITPDWLLAPLAVMVVMYVVSVNYLIYRWGKG